MTPPPPDASPRCSCSAIAGQHAVFCAKAGAALPAPREGMKIAQFAEVVATIAMRTLGEVSGCTCHIDGGDFDCWFRLTADEQVKSLAHALQADAAFVRALAGDGALRQAAKALVAHIRELQRRGSDPFWLPESHALFNAFRAALPSDAPGEERGTEVQAHEDRTEKSGLRP